MPNISAQPFDEPVARGAWNGRREAVTLFAKTNFRDENHVFGIREADRRAHMYVIGKTGTGKSTLLEVLIDQDIRAGGGLALVDPHGDLVERVLARIPAERAGDVIYLNAPDFSDPLGFNPLESVSPDKRPLVASSLIEVFKKIWADSWGPRMEHILRNCVLTLLDQPEATLADILRLLDDYNFRKAAVGHVENPLVVDFWRREFAQYPDRFRAEIVAPIQNKVGAFLANPVLQAILTQPKSSFDLRQVMDEGKILLVNLAKGRMGSDNAALLGALLVASIGLAGLSRADIPEETRRDFYLYLDEFQTFTTQSMANMLSELRKYRVNLILAHQYMGQIEDEIRDAILGNAGTMIVFRVGPDDAEILAKELSPPFSSGSLMNLPNHHIYLKLMIDGVVSKPFSAVTLPPPT